MAPSETNIDCDQLAKQLWALGDPVRLQILQMLPTEPRCDKACNVSKIAERIGLSQPSTSHHIRVLRQAGLVVGEKRCRDMIYWVQLDAADEVAETLKSLLKE
ncbi:MAG: ArsR/SmtB family transcription factor [Coraliomargarita sp.]